MNNKAKTAPLAKNPHVQELLSVMRANNLSGTEDLVAVIRQVGAMEQQLDKAMAELAAMRRELETIRDESHPLKNAVKALEKSVAAMRDKLEAVKDGIVGGCKNAVAAFREKGLSALRNVADFFKIRPGLEALQTSMDKGIKRYDAEVAKIEAMSAEFHKAGLHVKNMGRALAGRERSPRQRPPAGWQRRWRPPSRPTAPACWRLGAV